jgi:tetratricopeptide (TPR) repeat protein
LRLFTVLLLTPPAVAPAAAQQPPPASQEQQTRREAVEAALREGVANMARHRAVEALADFDRAVALAPNFGSVHAYRGLALVELRRYDEVDAEIALALRFGDRDPSVHRSVGYMYLMLGEFAASVRAYTRSLELQPRNEEALDRRARAYTGLGRMDAALADLDQAVAVSPGQPNPYFQRARLLAHFGRHEDALAAIDRAVAIDPRDYYYLSWKGDFLFQLGRPEEAAAAYRASFARFDARVAAMPPGRPASWVWETRLNLLGRSGHYAEAIALVEAELRLAPGNARALAARCWLRMEAATDLERALEDCEAALAAEPNHPVAAAARARLYLRLQRWADAERAFNALLANGGRSESNALYGRGLARIRRGDGAQGERDLREARRRKFDVGAEFTRMGLDLAAAPPAEN